MCASSLYDHLPATDASSDGQRAGLTVLVPADSRHDTSSVLRRCELSPEQFERYLKDGETMADRQETQVHSALP